MESLNQNNILHENKPKKRDRIGVVLYTFYIILLIAAFIVILKLIYIQAFYSPEDRLYTSLTPKSYSQTIEPERGDILDCNGRLLAISCPNYMFFMDCAVRKGELSPEQEKAWLSDAQDFANSLAGILKTHRSDYFYRLIVNGRRQGKRYVQLSGWVDRNTYNSIMSLPFANKGANKSGIRYETRNIRQYPYGMLARRTIGFVRDNRSRVTNTHIGLEGKFDYILHGSEGREYTRKSDYGSISNSDSTVVKAVDGNDLITTLDIDYQEIADKALREQIAGEDEIFGGTLILMDVESGAIRAMVNLQRDAKTGRYGEISNLAIGRKGEPGSVFKTVTLMSVLNDGYIKSLEETLPATTGHVEGTRINDSHIPEFAQKHHTRRISIIDGFKISSNYVFATLAVKNYGVSDKLTDKFLSNIHSYKLAEAYDFDLDGMQAPSIPSRNSRYWSNTDLGSVAFGYSTSLTPLHVITYYNAIANKGRMMKPYLVESISQNGETVSKRGKAILNSAICTRAVADTITRALKAVTEDGTGRRLKGAKCSVAGKTGTAYMTYEDGKYYDAKGRRQYQGTFVGFFPADAPKYSILCTVYSKPTSQQFQGGGKPASAVRSVIDQVYDIDPYFMEQIRTK